MTPLSILVVAVLIGVSWQLLSTITTNHNITLFLQAITKRLQNSSHNNNNSSTTTTLSIAFIFAHPDDEAMFFTPILHTLKEEQNKLRKNVNHNKLINNNNVVTDIKIHFLCITQGNYDKLGQVREKEMHASAKFYGADSCHVFNDPRCVDGPNADWDLTFVAQEVVQKKAIQELKANVIFTFDETGVSGHTNHRQVYQAVKIVADDVNKLENERKTNNNGQSTSFFKLVSLPIWRKYSSIFGVIVRNVVDRFLHASDQHSFAEGEKIRNFTVIAPPSEGFLSMRGLWNHYSQFVWFRFFYVMLASYSYENIFEEI